MIEAGDNTLGVDFHPRLTVIAGVGAMEREGLISELVGALGSARPGVHLEVNDGRGRHLAVFRPTKGRHRVIDADSAADLSAEFIDGDELSLLAGHGLDVRGARKLMQFSANDLRVSQQGDEVIERLATVDQQRLWSAADRMLVAEQILQSEADRTGSTPEDAAVIGKIEERHAELEQSIAHYEKVRFGATYLGTLSAIIGIAATVRFGALGVPFLAIAIIGVLAAMLFRGRVTSARNAEEEALEEAGASSYLGFHLQRVNGLLADDQHRKRLMEAAESSKEAQAEWRTMAGDVPVDFALRHKDAIVNTARTRRSTESFPDLAAHPGHSRDVTTDLAQILVARLSEVRSAGPKGDSLPLVLDEPFIDVDPTVKPLLLELLSTTAGSPQLIFLTEDPDVAAWARVEALTGDVSIIEPRPEHDDRAPVAVSSHRSKGR